MLFSRQVMSNFFWLHELQHAKLFYPSLSPEFVEVHVNWVGDSICLILCHPFSFCLQFFLASGSFSVSWLFTSGGQSIGASAAVFPIHTKGWFPLGLIGFILLSRGWLSRGFLSTTVGKHQFFDAQPYGPTLTSVCDYWKNHSLDNTDLLLAKWCLCYLICCLGLS